MVVIKELPHYTPGIYNPPTNAYYTRLECSVQPKDIGKFVGHKGKAFNAITRCAGVYYIWINNDTRDIEIWGPQARLENAKLRLIERMQLIQSRTA